MMAGGAGAPGNAKPSKKGKKDDSSGATTMQPFAFPGMQS